jgi:hypothetical protein
MSNTNMTTNLADVDELKRQARDALRTQDPAKAARVANSYRVGHGMTYAQTAEYLAPEVDPAEWDALLSEGYDDEAEADEADDDLLREGDEDEADEDEG